jgi:nucleoside-diphosphate-sugar epimerase
MMRVLLVGAHSTLGRVLHGHLAAFAEVITAGRSGCDVTLDLAGDAALAAIPAGLDAVVNCAADFGGSDGAAMLRAQAVNVAGLLKLCMACTNAGAGQLLHVSSIFAELAPVSPFFSVYALSKRHGDEAAQLYAATHGLALAIVRPAQIYGVGEAYRRNQPFLYTLIDRAEAGADIVIYGRNDALRNFIHVDDLARLLALAVQQRLRGLYRCVAPENLRYSQIAQAAIDAFGGTATLRFDATKADIPDNPFNADNALFSALGSTLQITIADGMALEAAHRKSLA